METDVHTPSLKATAIVVMDIGILTVYRGKVVHTSSVECGWNKQVVQY
jgi:hypothetical protein